MNTKKSFYSVLLGVAIALAFIVSLTVLAATFKNIDSLSGSYSMFLTNANAAVATTYYGATNIAYSNGLGVIVYSGSSLYGSNGSTYSTPIINTNSTTTYGQAWIDIPFFADANGNVLPSSLAVGGFGITASTTGAIAVGCVPIMRRFGSNYVTSTNTALWLPSFTPNGTVFSGMITNIPPAFMQGAWGMRVIYITQASNTMPGGFVFQELGVQANVP